MYPVGLYRGWVAQADRFCETTAKHLPVVSVQHNMFYIRDYTAVCQLETSAREDLLQFSSNRYPSCHF